MRERVGGCDPREGVDLAMNELEGFDDDGFLCEPPTEIRNFPIFFVLLIPTRSISYHYALQVDEHGKK